MEGQDNGWDRWKNHVLAELDRLNDTVEKHTESDTENFKELRDLITSGVTKISLDVTSLKSKAGVWGSIAGVIVSTVIAIGSTWIGK